MENLLNLSTENFIKEIKDRDTGFKLSLSNLIQARFSQIVMIKDSLVEILKNQDSISVPLDEIPKLEEQYHNCYNYLIVLESKYNILQELID